MSAQEKIAKSGLKKSLIFGGSITAATAGVGLAVSIPVYFDIQKQLKNQIDQTVNLAKYITDLTSKLGVAPDSEFVQELEGGYKVLIVNGQTQIFQSVDGGGQVLIMNMNADGSVSSASGLEGPSAQQMINVLKNAGEEFSDDSDEMEEIMRGYVEETERASRETEALMLGVEYEVLVLRDIISNFPEGEARNRAFEEERSIANLERESNNESDYTDAEWNALIQKAIDLKIAEEQARIDMEEQLEDVKNGAEVDFSDNPLFNQMVQNTQDPNIQGELQAIQQESQERMNDANQQANEAYSTASFEKAENSATGSASPALISVAQNPASWMNMFVKAMGGASYNRGTYSTNETNTLLMQSLYHTLIQQGLDEENFDHIINIIGHDILEIPEHVEITIENRELHDEIEQQGAVTFTELINTYTNPDGTLNTNAETSRLFILKVTIKGQRQQDGSYPIENGLLVARSSERDLIDFENMIYIDPSEEEKITTINYLIQAATLGIDTELPGGIKLENEILSALVALAEGRVDNNDIPVLESTSKQSFDEYMRITKFIQSQDDVIASHLSINLIHELLRYLLGSYEKPNASHTGYKFPHTGDMYDISYSSYVDAYNALIELCGEEIFAIQDPTLSPDTYEVVNKLWLNLFDLIIDPVTTITTTNADGTVTTSPRMATSPQLSAAELNKTAQLDRFTKFITLIDTYKDNDNYTELIDYINSFSASEIYNDVIMSSIDMNTIKANFALLDTLMTSLTNYENISIELIYNLLISNDPDITLILTTYNDLLTLNPTFADYKQLALPVVNGVTRNALLTELDGKINQLIRLETAVPRIETYIDSISILNLYNELIEILDRPTVDLFTKHIDEIIAVKDQNGFNGITDQMLWQLVNSDEQTLEYILQNYIRLIGNAAPGFDINAPETQEKINTASGVSAALAGQNMPVDQVEDITEALDGVLTGSLSLTPEQFGWIVEYTNTVFDVFTDSNDAYAQLLKVLNEFGADATRNTEIVNNIHTFNGWITTIKQQHPGQQVTVDMIKNYVWTQNIHSETYVGTNVNSGSLVDGPITGASVGDWVDPRNHDLGRRVYVMGHTNSQRQLSVLTPGGTTTTVVKANLFNDQSGTIINSSGSGGNHMSAMSRFIEDTNQSDDIAGYFYYVSLWDQYFYYKITIHQTSTGSDTYEITKVPFTGDKWTSGARNVAVTPDGKYMFVFVDQSQSIYRIDLSTGVSTALSASVIGNLGYGATAFEYNGANYLVASSGTVGGQQFINVYTVSTDGAINKVDSIEITSRLTSDTNQQISAFAIGDPIGTTIPIFAQGITGDLIQVIFDTSTNRFVASETFTLLTAARTQQLSGTSAQQWRGMVYNGGAITIYGSTRAIYIADQSNNLNNIFNLLMVH